MDTETHILGRNPPEILQLAGHRLRWQLLTELARSDRAVRELTRLIGEPQNLVSYHLSKLREGRIVVARQSSADRRDTYYGLDLAHINTLLAAAGGAIHPGLRLDPALRGDTKLRPMKVLFLCTGNSARSQMAEALAVAQSGGAVEAHSAGSHPKPLHPNALRAMREDHGLDLSAHRSKHQDIYAEQHFDLVVSLCDKVREVCPHFPGQPETIHWSIPNPATGEADDVTYPLFQQTATELATRISYLLATLAEDTPSPSDKKELS